MPRINISEFNTAAQSASGQIAPAMLLPPANVQSIEFFGTSVQSASVVGAMVRLVADANCRIAVGPNPTATSTGLRLIADTPEYFGVRAGDKIAVIEG